MSTTTEALEALDRFAELEPDWDSYGAPAPTPEVIALAKTIVRSRPDVQRVAPYSGGVVVYCGGTDFWLNNDGTVETCDTHATIRAALEEQERLQAKLERVETVRDAALRYIDLSPCDPDIFPEQKEAWTALREALSEEEGT